MNILKIESFLTGRWCRWQARFGGSFLSVAEQQQIHIFFFSGHLSRSISYLVNPHATSTPQTRLNCPPPPLSIRSWLLALGRLGVAEDSAGQRGRVERVTAWRGLNI